MTFFAIIGGGPNGLEIPLVICQTKEEAQAIVDQIPKEPGKAWLEQEFSEGEPPYVNDGYPDYESTELGQKLYSLIFKDGSYYPGCGSCSSLEIKEFEYGQPMVAWDLD